MSILIRHPSDIIPLFSKWYNKRQEHFMGVTLNSSHEVIKTHLITVGLVNRVIIHPREAFWPAVKDNACAVVFAHNHPSGSVKPSPEDEEMTDRLCKAGVILGFHVLDHIIFNKRGAYFSSRQNGLIKEDFDPEDLAQFVTDYRRG